MKYQLSISILVSNHIDTIRKCLESIKPLLTELDAELIIVDTGSTDGSVDIAREYTDKIIPFTWCNDFSAARNAGLNAANGEWFLYLDDDEWFEDVSEIIHFFHKEKYMEYGRAFYIQRNYTDWDGKNYSDSHVLRMFQIVENVHFKYRIHEFVSPELNPLKVFNSYVHHYGYIGNSEEKNKRNVALLELELKDNPQDMRMLAQLMNEYSRVNEYASILKLKGTLDSINRGSVNDALYCYAQSKIAESYYQLEQTDYAILYVNELLQTGIYNSVTKAYLYLLLINAYLDKKEAPENPYKVSDELPTETSDNAPIKMALLSFAHYISCVKGQTLSKEEFSQIALFEMSRIFQDNYIQNVISVLVQYLNDDGEYKELSNILSRYDIKFSKRNSEGTPTGYPNEIPNKKVSQTYENILAEAEQFFETCNQEYPLAKSLYNKITKTVDTALQQKNYDLLLSQLPYIETDEGYLTFQYIGEARQLLRILNIIALEEKYQTNSFAYQVETCRELIEKYKLCLFSLRRLLFALSPESVADAEYFLAQNQLSPFAIYILAKDELIIPNSELFQRISELYRLQWNNTEIQLFQQLTTTLTEA